MLVGILINGCSYSAFCQPEEDCKMLFKKKSGCCSDPGCCDPAAKDLAHAGNETKRQIDIEFLYLDLEVCTRCQGTDTTLDEAIRDVAHVIDAAGIEVSLKKVNVNTEALAILHQFVSSPTIRINGRDIALDVQESVCESCGDLCGDTVDCRIWTWQGNEYQKPPKAMIVNAILQAVYGSEAANGQPQNQPYQVPENLKRFYASMSGKGQRDDA